MPFSHPLPIPLPLAAGDEAALAGLALAHEAMGIITWLWDLNAGHVQWTGDLSPLLGLAPGAFGGNFPDYLRRLHPDDQAPARDRLAALLRGQASSYRAEDRVCWPDGSPHWLEVFGRAHRGADGRLQRVAGVIHDVTARRRAQDEIAHNEARLRRLIEDAPVAIGMSRGDQVLNGNPAFRRLFGFAPDSPLDHCRVTDLVAPQSLQAFVERGTRRAQGEPMETVYEVALRRVGGQEFLGLVSVSEAMLADGAAAVVFIQDLTESVRQREAVRRERDRATQYLQVAQAILVAADTEGRITMLNRRGHELLGWPEGSLIGQDWFTHVRLPAEAAAARAVYRDLMTGRVAGPEYHESEVLTRAGARRLIAWRNVLLRDAGGRVTGALASGEDITERHAAERALQALNAGLEQRVAERTAELEAARDAAEAGTRAKSEFLAHMSHEIRTPMNAIIGMTHLALECPDLGAQPREYLQQIRRASGTLLRIINQILDWSKIEAHRLEPVHDAFELQEVLDQLAALVAQPAADKGLAFTIVAGPGLPARLTGDPLRLGQVLLNLCGNAVKFTDRGEVRVEVQAEPAPPGRARLRFTVGDTGVGIPAEQLPRLFQPFDQLDPSITRRHGGTGLGLAISRRLVQHLGSEIEVHSTPGQGSRFGFALEFEPAAAPTAPRLPAAGATAGRLRGRRLLLVDDNELNRMVAGDLLAGSAGATLRLAADGQEALDWLQRERFDAVLMDLQMPGLDGYEATRRLRRDPALATLPVIAMTAHALARERERCDAAGMNDFVTKPFEPRELLAVLERWLVAAPAGAAEGPALAAATGLARCLGRPELYERILVRFVESRRDDAAVLQAALAHGDAAGLRGVAHALIASAGTIGAEPLAASASALHEAVDEDRRGDWPALVRRIVRQHGAVLAAIAARPPTLAA